MYRPLEFFNIEWYYPCGEGGCFVYDFGEALGYLV